MTNNLSYINAQSTTTYRSHAYKLISQLLIIICSYIILQFKPHSTLLTFSNTRKVLFNIFYDTFSLKVNEKVG